jgi:hypothetical protein
MFAQSFLRQKGRGASLAGMAILFMIYLAVGAVLFAQPGPGLVEPADFTWRRQGEIFRTTLSSVLLWPWALCHGRIGS